MGAGGLHEGSRPRPSVRSRSVCRPVLGRTLPRGGHRKVVGHGPVLGPDQRSGQY